MTALVMDRDEESDDDDWDPNCLGNFGQNNVEENDEEHPDMVTCFPAMISLDPGVVIADSGCRTAVAGTNWHKAHQDVLTNKGIAWHEEPESEFYRFGAGPIVESKTIY